ncbi:MAG: hypothetical protein ACPLPX_07570 [Candidatus Kapaibacteriota bacterium]
MLAKTVIQLEFFRKIIVIVLCFASYLGQSKSIELAYSSFGVLGIQTLKTSGNLIGAPFLAEKEQNSKFILFASEKLSESADTNKLEFEETDNQTNLLPERKSFMENFLWGENGFFRKIGITGELNIEQREKELQWRRTLLTIHQTTGLITWGLMLGTVITGQMWLDGKLDSPVYHKRFLYTTIGFYGITGLLSVVIPPPLQRTKEFSSLTIHKTIAWIHFFGMLATPILGKTINSSSDYYKTARIHQTVGYITFSAYTIAMLSILLFK